MSTPMPSPPPDIVTAVLQVVRAASAPLTADAIQQSLSDGCSCNSKELTRILRSETASGHIGRWQPGPRSRKERFWEPEESGYIRKRVLAALTAQPFTRRALLEKMKKDAVAYAGTTLGRLVNTTVEGLVKEKKLHLLPPSGPYHSWRYSLTPADPRNYLTAVKKALDQVCRKLKKTGVTPEDVLAVLADMAGVSLSLHHPETSPAPEAILNMVLTAIPQLDPQAMRQAPIWIPDLRQYLKLPKSTFDRAILTLAEQGKVFLNRHAHPAQMTDAEKETMIPDGQGNFYVVVVMRKNSGH